MKKINHHRIEGVIENLTGLRIGGSDDLLQIGGTDLTVIKHPVTAEPYLPGSSIKGKMRHELEKRLGKFGGRNGEQPCGCAQQDCLVCRVFGPHLVHVSGDARKKAADLGPSRIIVRDGQLREGGEIELKTENVINRKTGTAEHPRTVERVAAGSKWTLEIGIEELDDDAQCSCTDSKGNAHTGGDALVAFVLDGLRAIQETGLGAGVSRGYGQVRITGLKVNGQPVELAP